MSPSQFPDNSTGIVTLRSGIKFCVQWDTVETDDGLVFAKLPDGRAVAFPERRVECIEQVLLT